MPPVSTSENYHSRATPIFTPDVPEPLAEAPALRCLYTTRYRHSRGGCPFGAARLPSHGRWNALMLPRSGDVCAALSLSHTGRACCFGNGTSIFDAFIQPGSLLGSISWPASFSFLVLMLVSIRKREPSAFAGGALVARYASSTLHDKNTCSP